MLDVEKLQTRHAAAVFVAVAVDAAGVVVPGVRSEGVEGAEVRVPVLTHGPRQARAEPALGAEIPHALLRFALAGLGLLFGLFHLFPAAADAVVFVGEREPPAEEAGPECVVLRELPRREDERRELERGRLGRERVPSLQAAGLKVFGPGERLEGRPQALAAAAPRQPAPRAHHERVHLCRPERRAARRR